MDISSPAIVNGQRIANSGHASRLFRELYWQTDESSPELMEFFPELSDDSRLIGALVAAAQRAEAAGLDAEPFFALERIVRAFPAADYSA